MKSRRHIVPLLRSKTSENHCRASGMHRLPGKTRERLCHQCSCRTQAIEHPAAAAQRRRETAR